MASRVNLKFVLLLGGIVSLIVVGVVWVGMKNFMPGGEQNIERGQEAEKKGDLKQAINYYGRAVNKDRGNAEWVAIWLKAIEKYTPPDRKAYEDMYFGDYMGALRAMADADRRNVPAFKRYLEERYQFWTHNGSSLKIWESFEREATDIIKLYQGDAQGRLALDRYHGLAISGQYLHSGSLDSKVVETASKELSDAVKADPHDRDAALALNNIKRIQAEKEVRANHQAEADKILAAIHKDLEDFVANNKDDFRARFTLLELDIAKSARPDGNETMLDLLKRNKDGIAAMLDAVNQTPPEKTDYQVALALAPWVSVVFDDGLKRMADMLDHVAKGHEADADFLLRWALLEASRNQFDKAITLEQKIVALPDKPMSLDGLLLHTLRNRALQFQSDAWFARSQMEPDAAKRAEAVQKLKDLRKDLAARVGESDTKVLAIDGRLDFLAGDYLGARTRISRYNDQTEQTDLDMVMLEAQLLNQLSQRGAAKTKYERVLALQKNNVRALYALGTIEFNERDYRAASNHLGLATALYPDDPRLAELAKNAKELATGEVKDDPVLNCVVVAEQAGLGVTGDIQKSISIIRDCLKEHPGDLRLVSNLVQYLAAARDIDGAKAVLEDTIKHNPENEGLKKLLARIDRNPLDVFLDRVNESKATDLQKHLWRFTAYVQAGKHDEAHAELVEAVKIDPNDVGVINAQFDDALIAGSTADKSRKDDTKTPDQRAKAEIDYKNTIAEQDRLLAKARQLNLDKVGGDLFYARLLMNRGKAQDAVGVLRDVTGKDKLNLMAWRLLGLALLDQKQFIPSVDALKTAVGIKPDDVLSINACLQAMIAAGQESEALNMARKCENVAVTDVDFFETYLELESRVPGGDKAKAIDARKRLAERRPGNRANRTRLASLLINSGKTEEADKLIADLLKEDPNDAVSVQLQAACLGRKGNVADAVKTLQDYINSRKPEERTVELFINTARLMIQLGQPEQAIKLLTENRSAQDPKEPKDPKTPKEKPNALIDRELGDIKYNLAPTAISDEQYLQYMNGALDSYKAVLDSGAEDVGNNVRKRMIEVCLKAKMYPRMDKLISELPTAVQNEATILLLQAKAATAQDQRDKALRLYDQAVAADSKNPIVFFERGNFKSMDPKTLKDALADYEQMKRVDQGNVVARVQIARVLRMLGRDDDAVKALKDAIVLEPNSESFRLAVALMLRETGKPLEAAQAMEEAVAQFNGAKQWRLGAAEYWARVNRWDKALEHLRIVWQTDHSEDVAIRLTEALISADDAVNAYNVLRAPEVAPKVDKSLPLRLLKARIFAKSGHTPEASQEILDCLALVHPESLQETSLYMTGIAGIYPDVEAQVIAVDRLESTKPFTGYLALKAAETRLRSKSGHAAALAALAAIAVDPKVTDPQVAPRIQARAYSLLGSESYGDKNWTEAYDRFQKGCNLDPENAELNNNLAYIMATKLNKCKEALPYAVKACQTASNKSDFLDTLGVTQLCDHQCDEAAKTFTAGLQAAFNDTERVPLYIHMGKARVCQGDSIEARRVANVARDLMNTMPDLRKQYQTDWDELDRSIH
jgi:tetratricopeptide (TPR) repeat protein